MTPPPIQPVILCGGSGTRLWPLSREQYPKQFLALNGERTLLQETVLRLVGFDGAPQAIEEPLIVCNEDHRFLVAEQLRSVNVHAKAILLESKGKGTAPALTLAALHVTTTDAPVLLAMPSDHVIAQREVFQRAVVRGAALAAQGHVVTFGVRPSSPETGYGYILAGAPAPGAADSEVRYVEAFAEKPDAARARGYVASGRYLWNSGIFQMRASVWIQCIALWRRDILAACEAAYRHGTREYGFYRVEAGAFGDCPADSIDCAVMERIATAASPGDSGLKAVVVPLEAGWSDMGSWDALWSLGPKDASGNVIYGDVYSSDTRNALLITQHRLLACVGLEDVVVVETPDAVMVAHKDKAQELGKLVARLKRTDRRECLLPRKVHRPWGSYDSIESGERFQVKRIMVNPGASLSLQMHYHRAEHSPHPARA